MFWHVYSQARKCAHFSRIVLATDDQRIFSAAETLQVPVIMTDAGHPSGVGSRLTSLGSPDFFGGSGELTGITIESGDRRGANAVATG